MVISRRVVDHPHRRLSTPAWSMGSRALPRVLIWMARRLPLDETALHRASLRRPVRLIGSWPPLAKTKVTQKEVTGTICTVPLKIICMTQMRMPTGIPMTMVSLALPLAVDSASCGRTAARPRTGSHH